MDLALVEQSILLVVVCMVKLIAWISSLSTLSLSVLPFTSAPLLKPCPPWSQNSDFTAATAVISNPCSPPGELPKRFRTSQSPINDQTKIKMPSAVGLGRLNMSGSSQFCVGKDSDGATMLEDIRRLTTLPILIVDLRLETHGFVNEGSAVSWFCPKNWERLNHNKWWISLEKDEHASLNELAYLGNTALAEKITDQTYEVATNIEISRTFSESEWASTQNISYTRLYLADHLRPSSVQIDSLVSLHALSQLSSSPLWIHFHCRGGAGRTTTAMVMFDMLQNADRVPFSDFIDRHFLLGGSDLAIRDVLPSSWKYEHGKQRLCFLRDFYRFAMLRKKARLYLSWWTYQLIKRAHLDLFIEAICDLLHARYLS